MEHPSSSTGKTIALIEDEEILSNILSEKLRRMGYDVHTATDGEEGIALIDSLRPDLVLLDMLLPKLNGFGVLERMEEAGMLPSTPVIVISNSGQPVEIERAQKLGIRDYLVKLNFDPDEVLEKVREVLGGVDVEGGDEEGDSDAAAPVAASPETGASDRKRRVLVVEDDLFIADLLGRKLHSQFEVFQAGDTKAADDILAKNAVDVICLDIMLPGEDGYTFLQRLKANDALKAVPVIMLSNLGQQEEIEKGLSMGAVDYLIKANMSPDDILERIHEILALPS
jgi:two-component system, sensor histidine kinase and response regulator